MKITRAIGLLLFLSIVQFLLSDVFEAFSSALVAALHALEAAATLSEKHLQIIR